MTTVGMLSLCDRIILGVLAGTYLLTPRTPLSYLALVFFCGQENAKIDIRSLAEGFEDGYPVVDDDDLPVMDYC